MKGKIIKFCCFGLILSLVAVSFSGCRLFHKKKKHRDDMIIGGVYIPPTDNSSNNNNDNSDDEEQEPPKKDPPTGPNKGGEQDPPTGPNKGGGEQEGPQGGGQSQQDPPKDDGKPKATRPPENKSPDGKPSDEYPAEKWVSYRVKDEKGDALVYNCECKYTGSKEVKEPSDWEYIKEKGKDTHYWEGHASLGDGYECVVQHFREDHKDMPGNVLPKPFLGSPKDKDQKFTSWTDTKEGFEYEFNCGREKEIKTIPPDWKLDTETSIWKAEADLGDGWGCNCEAKPIKADNK